MATFKKRPANGNDDSQKTRAELRERIQTLEWSLAQKNRENKLLRAEIEDRDQEASDLNHEMNGSRNSDESQSG